MKLVRVRLAAAKLLGRLQPDHLGIAIDQCANFLG